MNMINRGVVVGITAVLIISVLTPGVAIATSGVQNPSQITDDQVYALSDNGQIEGWERAAYTLRTDDTDAPTQIAPPGQINGEELGSDSFSTSTDESFSNDGTNSNPLNREFNGEKNPIGIHNSGEDVRIVFDDDLASAGDQLSNQKNVEIVAAKLTPEDGASVPSTTAGAQELLSDTESANRNASFELLVNDDGELDGTGKLEHTEQFSPGHYVLFAAVKDGQKDGFETTDSNNISVDGDVVIIGMDQMSIQQGKTAVTTPSNPDSGDDLTFDVDATETLGDRNDVTHAVAIYDKSTFESARFDLVVNSGALGNGFSYTEDIQLEHSINEFNGISNVEDGTTLYQNDLQDGKVTHPVTAGSLIDYIADEVGTEAPNTDPILAGGDSSKYERIDASVTAVNGESSDTTVSVDTHGNFSTGTYQYVVVSTLDNDESQVSSAAGTFTLGGSDGDNNNNNDDDGDDSDNSDDNDDSTNVPEPPEETIEPPVERDGNNVSVRVDTVNAGETVVIDVNETDSDDNEGTALEKLNITAGGNSSNVQVSVSTDRTPNPGTPAVDRTSSVLRHVEVDVQNLNDREISQGTFTFRVSQDRLQERGVSPDDVQMYRYNGNSWNAIETTHLSGSRYRATTPGFSSFAIGIAEPSITVTDASLGASDIQTGDAVDVATTLENGGDRNGTITLDVTADGSTVKTKNVTVPADETITDTMSITFDAAGTYDVAVNGEDAGTLTVTDATQGETPSTGTEGDDTSTQSPATDGQPSGDGGLPLIALGIVVLLAAAAAAAYYLSNQS